MGSLRGLIFIVYVHLCVWVGVCVFVRFVIWGRSMGAVTALLYASELTCLGGGGASRTSDDEDELCDSNSSQNGPSPLPPARANAPEKTSIFAEKSSIFDRRDSAKENEKKRSSKKKEKKKVEGEEEKRKEEGEEKEEGEKHNGREDKSVEVTTFQGIESIVARATRRDSYIDVCVMSVCDMCV